MGLVFCFPILATCLSRFATTLVLANFRYFCDWPWVTFGAISNPQLVVCSARAMHLWKGPRSVLMSVFHSWGSRSRLGKDSKPPEINLGLQSVILSFNETQAVDPCYRWFPQGRARCFPTGWSNWRNCMDCKALSDKDVLCSWEDDSIQEPGGHFPSSNSRAPNPGISSLTSSPVCSPSARANVE